jgi:hypothetical protein
MNLFTYIDQLGQENLSRRDVYAQVRLTININAD